MTLYDATSSVGNAAPSLRQQEIGQRSPIEANWAVLLSRVSITAGLLFIGLIVLLSVIIAQMPATGLPEAYDELFWAVSGRGLYMAAILCDVLIWLLLGALFISCSALMLKRTPVHASLVAACGVGQLSGMLGAALRLVGTTALAGQYLQATPVQQTDVLQAFLHQSVLVGVHFTVGSLLWSIGFALVASSMLATKGLPRWLPIWLLATSVVNIAQEVITFAVPDLMPPMSFLVVIVMLTVALFSLGAIFNRRARSYSSL
jgi:hypothetical protein